MSIYNKPLYCRRTIGDVDQPVAPDGLKKLSSFSTELNTIDNTAVLTAGKRSYLRLKNFDSVATIYIGFGAAAIIGSPLNLRLLPNDSVEYTDFVPEDAINAIADAGTPKLSIQVGVA